MATKKEKQENFEDELKKLEEISTKLERGNISLEEAITDFEEGIKLAKNCNLKLEEAEQRINILIQDENGKMKEEKFEE